MTSHIPIKVVALFAWYIKGVKKRTFTATNTCEFDFRKAFYEIKKLDKNLTINKKFTKKYFLMLLIPL